MIKFIVGLIFNGLIVMIGVGLWYLFGKLFTGGSYIMDYWSTVQAWFWILFVIDLLYSLYKFGNKSSNW